MDEVLETEVMTMRLPQNRRLLQATVTQNVSTAP